MNSFQFIIPYTKEEFFSQFKKDRFREIYNNARYSIAILGDCIGIIDAKIFFKSNQEAAQWIVDNLKGHFYYIIQNKEKSSLIFGNSSFSILPIYFSTQNGNLFLSDKVESLVAKLNNPKLNKRFILENILFNYPLFNETAFTEINLLPSNSYIEICLNDIVIKNLKPIEDYFVMNPKPWRKAVNDISDLFIQNSEQYFPDEKYATSLTGGFDGRTLTALGKFYKKEFATYSFGSKYSKDVMIAKSLSSIANIEFIPFELNGDYIENQSLKNGLDFIKGSNGAASFARSHYMYSIKELSKQYKYIITGNFGSELFRTAHIAGVVISPNLYHLFNSVSFEEGISKVEASHEYQWLNKDEFKLEWESLKEDLKILPCYKINMKTLTKNQQFYKFVFEEIFRKYFGAEMVNQYHYLINRTPFLDFDFIKEILKTQLSGVYSDYFTNNPLIRFKGQVVYANIINKTYPDFGKELTDKGYCPNDLFSLCGKLKISQFYFRKKIVKKSIGSLDPYAVTEAFKYNIDFWKELNINTKLFNNKRIQLSIDSLEQRDSLFVALSQNYYINQLMKNYGEF